MAGEWEEIRKDFPAVARFVYLNAAAGSPVPRPVSEAVAGFYHDLETGGDRNWDLWIARREYVRGQVARLVNASPDEIAFVENTSAGINAIADLLADEGPVLTDDLEFPTVTLPWIHRGVQVHFVPAVEGTLRLEAYAAAYAPKAATIAVSHVQFSNGCRQNLQEFGEIKEGRRLVVSGSQSIGAFPVDVQAARIDALATAGHKWLCAGYGAGFVYVSRAILEKKPPRAIGWLSVQNPFAFENASYTLLDGARRVEMGCPSFAPIFALGAALDYLLAIGIGRIERRVLELNLYLTESLARAGLTVLSPGDEYRSGQTLVEFPDPKRAAGFLRHRGILVTQKPEGLRISTHFYNSEEDVDRCLVALREAL